MSRFIDLTNQKFGRLTVISRAENNGKFTCWNCKCDCGNSAIVEARNLRRGETKSCGCYYRETRHTNNLQHGKTGTELFGKWQSMKSRCKAKSGKHYINYAAKGISVCDEWAHSFLAFEKWSIENGFIPGMSIDRIDPTKDYCPENCRWVPLKNQAYNKTTTRLLTYGDATMSVAEWAEKYNVPYSIFYGRAKSNWPLEKIVSTPIDKRFSHARRHF